MSAHSGTPGHRERRGEAEGRGDPDVYTKYNGIASLPADTAGRSQWRGGAVAR